MYSCTIHVSLCLYTLPFILSATFMAVPNTYLPVAPSALILCIVTVVQATSALILCIVTVVQATSALISCIVTVVQATVRRYTYGVAVHTGYWLLASSLALLLIICPYACFPIYFTCIPAGVVFTIIILLIFS